MIRVFILAETAEEARDLASLLEEEDRVEVVGVDHVRNGEHSIASGRTEDAADVALVSGRALVTDLPFARIPVVLLSEGPVEEWDHRGPIRAWLTPQATPAEIVAAVTAASQGLIVVTSAQAEVIFNVPATATSLEARPAVVALIEPLTPRELQVLRMMAGGLGNKEIAAQLGISDHTAKFHVASILGKLNAATRTEAVAMGIRRGLVPI